MTPLPGELDMKTTLRMSALAALLGTTMMTAQAAC